MIEAFTPVIDNIISDLQSGVAPWRRGWKNSGMPQCPVRSDGEAFSGMNVIMLMLATYDKGYHSSPYWLTFQQALKHAGCVKKGERGFPALLYKTRVMSGQGDISGVDNGDGDKVLRFMRHYTVFHASQIDGLPDHFYGTAVQPAAQSYQVATLLAKVPARIIVGTDKAFYSKSQDYVVMPPYAAFESDGEYLGTLAHELCHWTNGQGRLDRSELADGSKDGYAMEELVALS